MLDYSEETVQAKGVCELNSEDCNSGGKAKLISREKSIIVQTPQNQPNVSDLHYVNSDIKGRLCFY